MMNVLTVFVEWYDDYFKGQQGADSPYSYDDVQMAFKAGFKKGKEAR